MIRRPPGSPLLPYTTLSRSDAASRPRRADRVVEHVHQAASQRRAAALDHQRAAVATTGERSGPGEGEAVQHGFEDRKSTRLNSSHANISYAVFCLKNRNAIR